MKTLIALLILLSSTAFAIDPKDLTIVTFDNQQAMQLTVIGDMTVKEAFAFLDEVALFHQNRMVIKDGQRYFRYGVTLLPKNRVYMLSKKRFGTKRKLIKL